MVSLQTDNCECLGKAKKIKAVQQLVKQNQKRIRVLEFYEIKCAPGIQ